MAQTGLELKINAYLRHLKKRGRSDLTIEHYKDYLYKFAALSSIRSLRGITITSIKDFEKKLSASGVTDKTINYYLIALRNFLRWLPETIRPLKPGSIELTRVHYKATKSKHRIDFSDLLEAVSEFRPDITLRRRDIALLYLLNNSSIKIISIPRLTRKNFSPSARSLTITHSSGKTELVKLTQKSTQAIESYLMMREDDSPYLFLAHDRATASRTPKALTMRSMQRIISHIGLFMGHEFSAKQIRDAR